MTVQTAVGRRHLAALTLALFVLVTAAPQAGLADSTPVGSLPKPTVTTVVTRHGSLVSVTAPARKPSTGLVWRIARPLNTRIVRQVGEADVGGAVVLVFRVVAPGRASIVLALTRGDSAAKAVEAIRYDIRAA